MICLYLSLTDFYRLLFLEQRLEKLPGRFDHKLILANDELNMAGERYEPTGEILYCVLQRGACGATLPLMKWFNGFEIGEL